MAFRSIIIDKATKISIDLNNIVIKHKDTPYWINLDEISNIIIEDPRCLVSLRLLTKLCEKGINVILTNESHMPIGSINTLFNNTKASKKYSKQIKWDYETKVFLWTEIVKNKILGQIETLKILKKTKKIDIMENYLKNLEKNDKTNREGLASRTYFKELFNGNFKRFNDDIINFCLNYVYQVLRSKISQEIVASGYQPCLGICHKNEFNNYNLADDFIEVFRPIVDYYVYEILFCSETDYLTPDLKQELVNILNKRIYYNGNTYKIHTVIQFYVKDLLFFMETGDTAKIYFPKIKCNI